MARKTWLLWVLHLLNLTLLDQTNSQLTCFNILTFNYIFANFSSISEKLVDFKYYLKNTTVFNFNVPFVVNFNAILNFLGNGHVWPYKYGCYGCYTYST